VTKANLIKVCLVISCWRIWGDNKVREGKWLLFSFFFAPSFFFSGFFSHCSAKLAHLHQNKIVNDCKSPLNQHRDGKQSYLSTAVCAYCFGKMELFFYWRYRTSAPQKLSWSANVFIFCSLENLWAGHCRASVPFELSSTVEQPCMWSQWKFFKGECGELMRCVLALETDSAHGCFSASASLQPYPLDSFSFCRMLFISVCSRHLGSFCRADIGIRGKVVKLPQKLVERGWVLKKRPKKAAALRPHCLDRAA